MNFQKIGVVGAGMMGSEIALCFACKGYATLLWDITPELAHLGIDKLSTALDKSIEKGRIDVASKEKITKNVRLTTNLEDLSDCDLIIEAVIEEVAVKKEMFGKLDTMCKPETIFCSNTSSISITKLASAVSKERVPQFLGAHFNSPASVMKLVEVIPALLTSEETAKAVKDLLITIDKEPVMVKDVVGFGLNRIFHSMYLEACRLVEEGVCSVEDVDKICKYGLGHPLGVFRLLDITGHDLNNQVDKILFEAYGDRFRPSPQIQRLVDAGRLGRKTNAGFYDYSYLVSKENS